MAADNKCCPYSFYVPTNDQALCDFLEAQSNLSMSIRLLIKAFIANYGNEYPDITIMDLKELLANMQVKPEVMAEKEAVKRNNTVKKTNLVENMELKPEVKVESAIVEQKNAEEQVSENIEDKISEQIDEIKDVDMVEDSHMADGETEFVDSNANESVENKEPVIEQVFEDTDDDDDNMPQVEVEPESPKKIIGSTRDAYNSQQNAQNIASIDDIMNMLGEM